MAPAPRGAMLRVLLRQIKAAKPAGAYAALLTRKEGVMTGEEAVVLGFILAAFVIFGMTLGWLSYK